MAYQNLTDLQSLMRAETDYVYFAEFAWPITYTPAANPQNPVQLLGIIDIRETGQLTTEDARGQVYHMIAGLIFREQDGPFLQGDTFQFPDFFGETTTWRLHGSSQKNIMDNTQFVEVISKKTYETGKFRRTN